MITVDGRCDCAKCKARTESIYRMIGTCTNCGSTPILMLFRAGDPTADQDCPVCGKRHGVRSQRLATADEFPEADPVLPAEPANLRFLRPLLVRLRANGSVCAVIDDDERDELDAMIHALDAEAAVVRPHPDHQRLARQAQDISVLLSDAGIGPCPITEGVRTVIQQRDAASRRGDRLRALEQDVTRIVEGFKNEALNGVICTPPYVAIGNDDTAPDWSAVPNRTWCARCQGRWQRLFELPIRIKALLDDPAERPTKESA